MLIPRFDKKRTEIIPPAPLTVSFDNTGIIVSQAMPKTSVRLEPLGNDKTGTRDTWTIPQKTEKDVVSKTSSSDNWSDDDEIGYIPLLVQGPLRSLSIMSNNDDNGIFSSAHSEVLDEPDRGVQENRLGLIIRGSFPNDLVGMKW